MSELSLSRELNGRIRRMAAGDAAGTSRATYRFLCGCGCLHLVEMSADQYDACGGKVFEAGHPLTLVVPVTRAARLGRGCY